MLPPIVLLAIAEPIFVFSSSTATTAEGQIPELAIGADDVADTDLVRGLQGARFAGGRTVIGSYGEFTFQYLSVGPDGPYDGTATLQRLVLFVAHNFSTSLRGYVEAEWEHAVACTGCRGAAEIEQAFVDWKLLDEDLTLRGGLILVPMGIVNQWHEPPVYHGTFRPKLDQLIIPTTWRELGLGVTGRFLEIGRYELYVFTPLDAASLGPVGIAGASAEGSLGPANGYMFSGRAEVEPVLGAVFGFSAIFGDLGGGSRFFDNEGAKKSLWLPLIGLSADARFRRSGIEARVVAAAFFMPEIDALVEAHRADGSLFFPDPANSGVPPTRTAGVYGEVAYDVFRLIFETEQQLLPFVRLEWYDTQSAVPEGFRRDPLAGVVETTFGLSYRPFQQLVFKLDYQLRDRRLGLDEKQLNFGMGYMF